MNILVILILVPIIGSLHVCLIKDVLDHRRVVCLGLFYSIIVFCISLYLWFVFNNDSLGFQFVARFDVISDLNLGFVLGVDGVSLYFIILTALLTPICILMAYNNILYLVKEYVVCFLIMESLLFLVFLVLDLLGFYIFFEVFWYLCI